MHELYKKHRPKRLKDVLGQSKVVTMLERYLKDNELPHSLLFSGPPGTGKTTIARILKKRLGCGDADFNEVNSADFRGIEKVREIRSRMTLATMGGKCRIWLLDEVHQLSSDAQHGLLKLLEDTPVHVYFMLATTNPEKLKRAIVSRCAEMKVRELDRKTMRSLIDSVLEKEHAQLSDEVIDKIIEVADGSARKALVILDQVYKMDDEEKQLNSVMDTDSQQQAIQLARALMNPRVKWPDIVPILQNIKEEPETVRRILLGYYRSVMMGNNIKMVPRAYLIIQAMRDHFYDCGAAGLAAACFECCVQK